MFCKLCTESPWSLDGREHLVLHTFRASIAVIINQTAKHIQTATWKINAECHDTVQNQQNKGYWRTRNFRERTKLAILALLPTLNSHTFPVSFLFAPNDASKCEIRCQWVQEDYILRFQNSLVLYISDGSAKSWQYWDSCITEFVNNYDTGSVYVKINKFLCFLKISEANPTDLPWQILNLKITQNIGRITTKQTCAMDRYS